MVERFPPANRPNDHKADKEFELNWAKEVKEEHGIDKFMLVCTMNNRETTFKWCDEEHNFIGATNEVDGKYIYTWYELLKVYDNAIDWISGVNDMGNDSTRIQIMTLK